VGFGLWEYLFLIFFRECCGSSPDRCAEKCLGWIVKDKGWMRGVGCGERRVKISQYDI